MAISFLNKAECNAVLTKIISEFGDGQLGEGQYIFDVITRLPRGFTESKLTDRELLARLAQYVNILIVFDPNPKNDPFRLQLLHAVGVDGDVLGLKIPTEDLSKFFSAFDCDFYILNPEGILLSVASHEDTILNGQRIMWCPIPIEGFIRK